MTTDKTQRKVSVPSTEGLDELHCANPECGKFLGYARIDNGLLNIKCHRCKTSNLKFSFTGTMPDGMMAKEISCPCGRFLYLIAATSASVVVKCRICGEWHQHDIKA